MTDKLCWGVAVSTVYVAADSLQLSCTHKSKQIKLCWFAECYAILHPSEVIIHLKSPPINTLSNTLSNTSPSLINNECCKYLYIQVAAQPCVTDQNQITLPWMACKRPEAVRDADSVHWKNACVTELNNVQFIYSQAFIFCIVWKTERSFMGCVM